MRWYLLLIVSIMSFSSCSIREREKELERKNSEINQREQELLFLEKTLMIKEEELLRREKTLDSMQKDTSLIDTLTKVNPDIAGMWTVKMTCTETTCSGSAIGDTRTEQWDISIQDESIIAKAMSGNKLVRTYTGNMRAGLIYLTTQQEATASDHAVRMVVRIQETRTGEMEGRREIIRTDDCRIMYKLELKKL